MNAPSDSAARSSALKCAPAMVIAAATIALSWRIYWVVSKFSVNLFYYDEWDYYAPLFNKMSWWRAFFLQHNPSRQGLGVMLVGLLLGQCHWNSKVQAYAVGAVLALAAIAALYLKTRILGPLVFSDVVIPVMFLGLGQWEVLISSPGLSAQAMPLLLTICYSLAWCQRSDWARYPAVAVINFLLIFTGYGFFMGVLTPLLLAADIFQRKRRDTPTALQWVTLAISVFSLAIFFYHYDFTSGAACYHFPESNLTLYPLFMAVGFAMFLGIKHGVLIAAFVGSAVLLFALGILIHRGGLLLSQSTLQAVNVVIVVLLGYSLLFATAAALGRVCLGMEAARASRNMMLLIPTFLGIYFFLLKNAEGQRRKLVALIFLAALLPACIQRYHKEMEGFSAGKLAWKKCYLQHKDIGVCNSITGFQVYPWPESIDLKAKLDYLEQNKLNLYASPD